jgi:hypothetical protein
MSKFEMTSSANGILGACHPITRFLGLLLKVACEDLPLLAGRYTELLIDTAMPIADHEASTMVQLVAVRRFCRLRQLDMAPDLSLRLWNAVQPISAVPTLAQRACSSTRTYLLILRGDYSAAENLLTQQIQWTVAATQKPNGNFEGVVSCVQMAGLYTSMGRLSESVKYGGMALEGAIQCCGIDFATSMLQQFERFLERHTMTEDLARLRKQYGHLWDWLEEWKLRPDDNNAIETWSA